MVGKLAGDIQVTCNDCGGVFLLRQEYTVNLLPIKFCPQCGTSNLRVHASALSEMLKAGCFAGVDGRLVQMLYSVWALDPDAKTDFPRFIDYLNDQLENAEID